MRNNTKRQIRLVGGILFTGYILLLIYFLFFAEWYGRGQNVQAEPNCNFTPLLEIKRYWIYREVIGWKNVFLNLAGNVIGFIPFGFILPALIRGLRKGFGVIFLGCFLSAGIECMQFILKVGSCDVDDVILNTAGVIIGYLLFVICNGIRRLENGKKTKKRFP